MSINAGTGVHMHQLMIDTNLYVAFKRNHQATIDLLRHASTIALNTIVLGELLAGFRGGQREANNRLELDLFLDAPRVRMLTVDEETADFFSLIFNQLKSQGTPIPTNDIWIAASAMRHGLILATFDNHFSKIAGLNLQIGLSEVQS